VSISDKNRKILWGKSGNKCAMCKHTLVFESTQNDNESVVGEECHIISGANKGPRSDSDFPREKINDVTNLILLCRIHHKKIDDQVETYPPESLRTIKDDHEKWVEDKLKDQPATPKVQIKRVKEEIPDKLPVINSGKEMFNLAAGACAFYNDYSDDLTDEEVDAVSGFIQNVKDWAELAREMEPSQRINASRDLDKEIKALRQFNIFAFAAVEKQKIVGGTGGESSFPVLHLSVNKANDSNVVTGE
jgi:hypothetical protein